MHPFWFFLALLLACCALLWITAPADINRRRAHANNKPLGTQSRGVHEEAAAVIPQGCRTRRR